MQDKPRVSFLPQPRWLKPPWRVRALGLVYWAVALFPRQRWRGWHCGNEGVKLGVPQAEPETGLGCQESFWEISGDRSKGMGE